MDKYTAAEVAYNKGLVTGREEVNKRIVDKIIRTAHEHPTDFCVLCGRPVNRENICIYCKSLMIEEN